MARDVSGVTHLGGDRWRVRIYAGLDPLTHRQLQRSRTFRAPNRTNAMRLAESHRVAMRNELRSTADRKGTVAELAESFLDLKRRDKSPTTVKAYATIVARIVDTFGHLPVASLRGEQIDDWYGRLQAEKMSAATIAHYHAVLRAILRLARKRRKVERIATDEASPPSVPKFEVRPPTEPVVRLMLADVDGDLGAALHVAASTGARRGEICGLSWPDISAGKIVIRRAIVEVRGGVLHEKPPKGGKARTIPITAQTWLTLMRQRQRLLERAERLGVSLPDDGPVFGRWDRHLHLRPQRPSWLSHGWDRVRKAHGVTFRLHDLRHFHATFLTDAGIPVTTGAKRLGHAQVSTYTDIYGHGTDEADTRAVALLELALPAAKA